MNVSTDKNTQSSFLYNPIAELFISMGLFDKNAARRHMNFLFDKKQRFACMFDSSTGFYARTGVLDEQGKDTGIEPFMASYPQLLDIGIMQTCVCSHKCNVDCYQKAISRTGSNMSLEDYESIMKQSYGKMWQCALGGAGDVDTHENFKEILEISRHYKIVPNFTTSGIMMTKEKAELCKQYCGAVAVSEHFADYTNKSLNLLIREGVKTNLHYVLSKKTIGTAIERLKKDSFKNGINAVVFLLYKPVGLGKEENVLQPDDPLVKEFFHLVDKGDFHHKIGFDSCSCPGIINYTQKINKNSLDFCEGGRFSAYIDANMNMMPCSFANQDSSWFVNLREHSIQEAWESKVFNNFRYSLSNSCPGCKNRSVCGGGCPLVNQVTLCNLPEKAFVKKIS